MRCDVHFLPVCIITVASANDGKYSGLINNAKAIHSIPRGAVPFFNGGGTNDWLSGSWGEKETGSHDFA